jgi:ketosteroid isomerase-like protein
MSELKTFSANLIEAVTEQDLTKVHSLLDPSFVIHYDASLPFGGSYHGIEGFFTVLTTLATSLTDLKTEQLNFMEDTNGEQYTLIINLTARSSASGRPIATQVSEVWTVREGKAVEARIWYWGAAGLLDS